MNNQRDIDRAGTYWAQRKQLRQMRQRPQQERPALFRYMDTRPIRPPFWTLADALVVAVCVAAVVAIALGWLR